jgi:hypothetical protein
MAMEKNGAISNETPNCGNNCGCSKQASARQQNLTPGSLFPDTIKEANAMDDDITKRAVEAVRASTKVTQ